MGSPSAIAATAPAPTADSRVAPATDLLILRIWPSAMIALGLGLTVAWACLLGYGLVTLIRFAI